MFKEAFYTILRHNIVRQRSQRVAKTGFHDMYCHSNVCCHFSHFEVYPVFFESTLAAFSLMAPDWRIYDIYALSLRTWKRAFF